MALLLFGFALHAQSYLPASLMNPTHQAMFGRNYHFNDSTSQKKWFVTRHTALSTSYTFFRGGHASMVAVPMGLQLNRRLNPNLYAFANATIAPAYINFSRSFAGADLTKGMANHPFSRSGKLAIIRRTGQTPLAPLQTGSMKTGLTLKMRYHKAKASQ